MLALLGIGRLSLEPRAELLEPALDDLQVGEDQLLLERLDLARGRGRRAECGRRERSDHVQERVGLPQLAHVQARALPAVEAREIHHLDARVDRLFRLEQHREPCHAVVGHAHDADVEPPAPRRLGDTRLRAGEEIEQRRLSAARESDDAESHDDRVYTALAHGAPDPGPSGSRRPRHRPGAPALRAVGREHRGGQGRRGGLAAPHAGGAPVRDRRSVRRRLGSLDARAVPAPARRRLAAPRAGPPVRHPARPPERGRLAVDGGARLRPPERLPGLHRPPGPLPRSRRPADGRDARRRRARLRRDPRALRRPAPGAAGARLHDPRRGRGPVGERGPPRAPPGDPQSTAPAHPPGQAAPRAGRRGDAAVPPPVVGARIRAHGPHLAPRRLALLPGCRDRGIQLHRQHVAPQDVPAERPGGVQPDDPALRRPRHGSGHRRAHRLAARRLRAPRGRRDCGGHALAGPRVRARAAAPLAPSRAESGEGRGRTRVALTAVVPVGCAARSPRNPRRRVHCLRRLRAGPRAAGAQGRGRASPEGPRGPPRTAASRQPASARDPEPASSAAGSSSPSWPGSTPLRAWTPSGARSSRGGSSPPTSTCPPSWRTSSPSRPPRTTIPGRSGWSSRTG